MRVFRDYPVKIRQLTVGGQSIQLLGPDEYEKLLDDPRVLARFERDEFMPYWAEFWPACLLLAERVAQWPSVVGQTDSPRVLELGCGLGLAALLAAQRGYRVIASDYDDDALAFVTESARENGISPPQTRFIDWRLFYPDLVFERIIAAEILYEARNLEPVAAFVANHLGPGGYAWIVDANRSTADRFEAIARGAGLSVITSVITGSGVDGKPIAGRLFELRHA